MNWDGLGQIATGFQFVNCEVRMEHLAAAKQLAGALLANQSRYAELEKKIGVPWFALGALHQMEASGSFYRHLHNGDPLTARTVHVPAGRPVAEPIGGVLPYTWEESATDALVNYPSKPPVWDAGHTLIYLEAYNGLGYRRKGLLSPYVWSFTTAYVSGKFVADGVYDASAVSNQVGAAAILKMLTTWKVLSLG